MKIKTEPCQAGCRTGNATGSRSEAFDLHFQLFVICSPEGVVRSDTLGKINQAQHATGADT